MKLSERFVYKLLFDIQDINSHLKTSFRELLRRIEKEYCFQYAEFQKCI